MSHPRPPVLADRINQAADQHPRCPKKHGGRLRWVQEQLAACGEKVSTEAIRRWFAGEGYPQQARGKVLADILGVDAAWLLWGGDDFHHSIKSKRVSKSSLAIAKIVAGLIEIDGGVAKFPTPDDARAVSHQICLYATIKRVKYELHVALAEVIDEQIVFTAPNHNPEVIILAVVRSGFTIQVYEVISELTAGDENKHAGSLRVALPLAYAKRIYDFGNRL